MTQKFNPGIMRRKYGNGGSYATPPGNASSALPTASFLSRTLFGPLLWLWQKARKHRCDDIAWVHGSAWLAEIFEGIGGRILINGMDSLGKSGGPCVIIANHMSTLETFILPGIIRPIMPVTFVVKKSLVSMPVFGPVMRSRDPVVVGRASPREDLAAVLEEGSKRLADGISIVVFPQHTRALDFDAARFNTIGIKLAKKAGVPVVPLALKTDAWGQGRRIKELGAIRPDLPAHFEFASPMNIEGAGRREHALICDFIASTVARWQSVEGVNR